MGMIDMHPMPGPAYGQVIKQNLIQCGLRPGTFTVQYEDDLQSIQIVVSAKAGASLSNMNCLRKAVGHEIVTFHDGAMQEAYGKAGFELIRPKLLADARADLQRRGLLANFPKRKSYLSNKLFAGALERHCGLAPGAYFAERQGRLIARPMLSARSAAEQGKLSCLTSAIMYVIAKGEPFKFAFIGNEAALPRKPE
jgi:hypothetical protein